MSGSRNQQNTRDEDVKASPAAKRTRFGFVVRTGGGLRERTFGIFSAGAEAEQVAEEDAAEGHEAAPASNLREGKAKARKLNEMAELGGRACRFALVTVMEGTPEYKRLYALFLSDTKTSPALFTDEEVAS